MSLKTVGRYRVVEVIGHGAMGEVHKAFDPVLKRHVAIKMLTAQHGLDEDMRRRFEREAQSAAQLNHPNIITVYELGEENGNTFIAMELLAGVDLKEMIGTPALRDLGERLRIIDQVFAGVAFAHERGVVHRDLKPANIRVLPNGKIKVVDFGLARMSTGAEMTQAGMILGTPHYMAPEQVQGERVDAAADVFALGALFYEVLTGKRAFAGDNLHTILGKVLTEDPESLRLLSPEVPVPVEAVVLRALAKERRDRYANAGELRAALHVAVPSLAPVGRSRPGATAAGGVVAVGNNSAVVLDKWPSDSLETYQDHAPTYASLEQTPRPTPTVHGDARSSRMALFAGLGVGALLLAAAVGLVVTSSRRGPVAPPRAVVTPEPFDKVLREQFIESLVQLGGLSLENKEYADAIQKAEQALKEDSGSVPARDILTRAQTAIRERDGAAAAAREALARKDMSAASAALSHLLALDPRHPAVPELSAALNERFRDEARAARQAAAASRAEAVAQQANGLEGFRRAETLVVEGDALLGRREYVAAAQKFAEARDLFGRVQRTAQAEAATRKVADAEARRAQQRVLTPGPVGHPPVATAGAPSVAPTVAPTAVPATPPPATPPPAATVDPAIRQVLADYGRALESKDLALFRSAKPNLSEAEQKKLEQTFKMVKSHSVGITIDHVEIASGHAVVRVTRKDVMNGQTTPAVSQTFRLVQTAEGWKIESIGQ